MIKKITLIFSFFIALIGYMFLPSQNVVFAQTATELKLYRYSWDSSQGIYVVDYSTPYVDSRSADNLTPGSALGYLAILTNDLNEPIANQPIVLMNTLTGGEVPGTTDAEGKVAFFPPMSETIFYAAFTGSGEYRNSISNSFSIKINMGGGIECYYEVFTYTKPANGSKSLYFKRICHVDVQDLTYTLNTTLGIGDSFSKGEVRDCTVGGLPKKCVLNDFKYYYSCQGNQSPGDFLCTHASYNSVAPDTALSCTNVNLNACSATTETACSGTSLKNGFSGGSSGVIVKTRKTEGGIPVPGVDPIQISCFSAAKNLFQESLVTWQTGSLGYSAADNDRSNVHIVACINDNDCKANESCDTTVPWYEWSCIHKEIARPVRVFATTNRYTSGQIGGLAGADAKCAAEAASSTHSGDPLSSVPPVSESKWKAWLSGGGFGGHPVSSAKDRISDGQFVLVDFTRIADNKANLLGGKSFSINRDKSGAVIGLGSGEEYERYVWTGTNNDGTRTNYTCEDWGTSLRSLSNQQAEGTFGSILGSWSNVSGGGLPPAFCSGRNTDPIRKELGSKSFRLYCFEDLTPDILPVSESLCKTGTATRTEVENGLISTTELLGTFGNNVSASNLGACVISDEAQFAFFKIPTYSELLNQFFTKAKSPNTTIPTNAAEENLKFGNSTDHYPLIHVTGDLTLGSGLTGNPPSSSSGPGVVFVDGDLNIAKNYTYGKTATNDSYGTVFVVKGNTVIETEVTEVNAVIIGQGTIYTASDPIAGGYCDTSSVATSRQLTINGSLISLKDPYKDPLNPTPDSVGIKFCRANTNPDLASEKINLQSKYLSILRNIFSTSIQKWTEIPGLTITSSSVEPE